VAIPTFPISTKKTRKIGKNSIQKLEKKKVRKIEGKKRKKGKISIVKFFLKTR
jgi:hypothetical protein